MKEFLTEFEDVVCPSKVLPPVGTDVETSGPPIASRFRRLDAETSILYFIYLKRKQIMKTAAK